MADQPTAVIILKMPEPLREALDRWAYEHDMDRSKAVRHAVSTLLGLEIQSAHGNTVYASPKERRQAKYQRRKMRAQAKAG